MPTVTTDGVDIYYERRGRGPRLLFLNGSGGTIEGSSLLLSLFEGSFDLLAHDNRGLGRSSPSPGPYGMAACSSDALAVMDAVGWADACVLGVSFGGMVAQELAVSAPERVVRLALLCTSPGGEGGASYPLHELEGLSDAEVSSVRPRLLDTRFDEEWLAAHPNDRRLVEMMADRSAAADPDVQRGRHQQFEARRAHDVWDRLPRITCPTLVACGRFDGIAPPGNSAAIASRLVGAELRTYEGGHAFLAQDPRAAADVVAFLSQPGPLGPGG
jgi:pimeloyl-ACP methyl ester carboxylesterase